MLEALISSRTRIKLLLKFFLNSKASGYLRGLEQEFGESSNGIRVELNRFEKSGLLNSYFEGNKKYFTSNTDHPLYNEIHNIVLKYVGLDKVVETIIERLGELSKAFLVGDFARGLDAEEINLVLVGQLEATYLDQLISKASDLVGREINYDIFNSEEAIEWDKYVDQPLLLWQEDE